jgi:hypothetical protein
VNQEVVLEEKQKVLKREGKGWMFVGKREKGRRFLIVGEI